MNGARFAACVGLLLLLLSAASSSAQQTFNPSSIMPNPMVEQMLRVVPDGESIVELTGYVGPSTPDTVRLYPDLTMSRYFDIPRNAIVNLMHAGESKNGAVKLYVRGVAPVVMGSRTTANVAALSFRASALPNARPAGRNNCLLYAAECLAGVTAACIAMYGCLDGMQP
jgi:hypothetical protein